MTAVSIFVMLVSLLLVAQSAGFAQLALPSLGPVLLLELAAVAVPAGLAAIALLLVMKSKGFRHFQPQKPYRSAAAHGTRAYSILLAALSALSFFVLWVSFFMPWVRVDVNTFTLSDLYVGFMGQNTTQRHLLRQLVAVVSSGSVLADSFVAVALVMALYPASMLFTLVSLYPRKVWPVVVASTLTISSAILALYGGQSLAEHLHGPIPLVLSRLRLESGPSMAMLAGGLLSLEYLILPPKPKATSESSYESTRIPGLGGTENEKKKLAAPLGFCPACGTKVDPDAWYCPKCKARLTVQI
jgi:hypothetical protein